MSRDVNLGVISIVVNEDGDFGQDLTCRQKEASVQSSLLRLLTVNDQATNSIVVYNAR